MYNIKINDIDECVSCYFKNIKDFTSLKKSDERVLLENYLLRNDISSRNKLIKSNLKYAISIANNYRGKGVDFSELISEANDGLIEAIDKFDMSKDVKLITYAKWWIVQRLNMCLSNKRKHASEELPTDHQEQIDEDNEHYKHISTNKDYESIVADEMDVNKNNDDRKLMVAKLLDILNEREREIIELYYGINCNIHNLEEVGSIYNITKERTRQIIESAFKKIRSKALLIDEPVYL